MKRHERWVALFNDGRRRELPTAVAYGSFTAAARYVSERYGNGVKTVHSCEA